MNWAQLHEALLWKFPDAIISVSVTSTAGEILHWQHPATPQPAPERLPEILAEYAAIQHEPDWDGFYAHFEGSDVEMAIAQSQNKLAFIKLGIEFGKRSSGSLEVENLQRYWNQTIMGVALTVGQIATVNQWAQTAHLPIRLDDTGLMEFV